MGVLENRKKILFYSYGLLLDKSKKNRSMCLWKATTMLRKICVRFIETFFRYQLVLKLLEWVFRSVYN